MWFWVTIFVLCLAVGLIVELWAGWAVGAILDKLDGPL